MRYLVIVVLAILTFAPMQALGVASKVSKQRIYHTERHGGSDMQTNQALGDLFYPWPFHHGQGSDHGMARELRSTGMISTTDILFESNSSEIKPQSRRTLDEIGGILSQNPNLKIEIGGHTDAVGSDEYNKTLSRERAQQVKTYLVSHFPRIKAGNLTVAGYGRSKPVASNETSSGRKQNRRVEFKVLSGAK